MGHEILKAAHAARTGALAIAIGLAGFLGLFSAAALLYPGGNWLEPAAPGHRFWKNFFCDLTQPVSLSGIANPLGSRLAQASLLAFAGALGAFFWILPRRFAERSRLRRWVHRLGALSLLCFVLVPLTPSEHFGRLHAVIALSSGALGALASGCAVAGLYGAPGRVRWLAALGASALLVGLFDGVLFVWHLNDAAAPPVVVPAAQKVAALLLTAWMAALASVELVESRKQQEQDPGQGREPRL